VHSGWNRDRGWWARSRNEVVAKPLSPKACGIAPVDLGSFLRVISHRVHNAKEDADQLRIVLIKSFDLIVRSIHREITQLVIRIDQLHYHPNHHILIRKLEELLIREALS
jgi:hypothetical protein